MPSGQERFRALGACRPQTPADIWGKMRGAPVAAGLRGRRGRGRIARMILYSHRDGLDHLTPEGHPERPARLPAVMEALDGLDLDRREAPPAEDADLLRCHPQGYLDALADAVPAAGRVALDPDTWMSPGSLVAARRAVGMACAAVDAVVAEPGRAFVAARPPGHHAEPATPMGFCLLSTAAIAARRAMEVHGMERVAVVDFDVHHGNGTQAVLWDEPRARFVSSHQMPLWPGTGAASERGAHDQVRNLPLDPGTRGAAFAAAWDGALDWLDAWEPDLVILSAGFDGHADDPLASLELREDDFAALTRRLRDLADAHAGGRVVSVLEGGYDLAALGRSARAHVEVLDGG